MPSPKVIETRQEELANLEEALTNDPIEYKDPRYFAFHKAAGEPRGNDPVADFCATIKKSRKTKSRASTCQLFSGFRGSGKSTELQWTAEAERGRSYPELLRVLQGRGRELPAIWPRASGAS